MSALPGPTESPILQTARWVARPIRFLEDCRRRYGDVFSVMFQGFGSPLTLEIKRLKEEEDSPLTGGETEIK